MKNPQKPKNHQKLNLLFIITDQQRQDTMKVYGNQKIKTPNLDLLAEKSVVFERYYVAQPVCTPSRATMMTGLYPHTHGSFKNNIPLDEKIPILIEMVGDQDYVTGYFGKWHLGNEIFKQRGFTHFESTEDMYTDYYSSDKDRSQRSGYHRYLAEHGVKPDTPHGYSRTYANQLPKELSKPAYVANKAIEFLERYRDRPFILYLSFLDPHTPFNSVYDDLYNPEDMEVPETFFEDMDPTVLFRTRAIREVLTAGKYPGYEGIIDNAKELKKVKARYWGKITLVDEMLGRVFKRLAELGLEQRTIIVFTTDHGEMMGDHRLVFKSVMYEEAIRVPFILSIPSLKNKTIRISTPVSQVDLVPTLLDLMSQPLPKHLQGKSWVPYLFSKAQWPRENVIVEWNGPDGLQWQRDGKIVNPFPPERQQEYEKKHSERIRTIITPEGWKLSINDAGEGELYNVRTDPKERKNLYYLDEHLEKVKRLVNEIKKWQKATGDKEIRFDERLWRRRRDEVKQLTRSAHRISVEGG